MMNDSLISAGSIFLSGAFASLLYPPKQEEMSTEELEAKVKLAIELIKSIKVINAPLLMEKLNCNAKIANKIINILIDKGFIIPQQE